ncbi:MAG: hypothetical protein IPI07_13710 [Flavobacteriales bacterium]|nr:hypothetical protein [Flavobacteriales bacterium]
MQTLRQAKQSSLPLVAEIDQRVILLGLLGDKGHHFGACAAASIHQSLHPVHLLAGAGELGFGGANTLLYAEDLKELLHHLRAHDVARCFRTLHRRVSAQAGLSAFVVLAQAVEQHQIAAEIEVVGPHLIRGEGVGETVDHPAVVVTVRGGAVQIRQVVPQGLIACLVRQIRIEDGTTQAEVTLLGTLHTLLERPAGLTMGGDDEEDEREEGDTTHHQGGGAHWARAAMDKTIRAAATRRCEWMNGGPMGRTGLSC